MTEQWQELKETITEMRDNDGTGTQQDVCKFLVNYMETLEKQMQQLTDAKETIIKSALKYLVKRQIAEGSVGFAVDNDHDHDCCWDDVLAWLEAQPSEDCISREAVQDLISRWLSDYLLDETREALETINYKVGDMPSVTPQRQKGKWIKIEYDVCTFIYKCSKCGMRVVNPYKYCPICGAEMGGTDETN